MSVHTFHGHQPELVEFRSATLPTAIKAFGRWLERQGHPHNRWVHSMVTQYNDKEDGYSEDSRWSVFVVVDKPYVEPKPVLVAE